MLAIAKDPRENKLHEIALFTLMSIDQPDPKVTIPLVVAYLDELLKSDGDRLRRNQNLADRQIEYLANCGPFAEEAIPTLLPMLLLI